ncbi:MAG: molybdopterin-dependent oxidoreductase [Acidimicrobiia bacterium]
MTEAPEPTTAPGGARSDPAEADLTPAPDTIDVSEWAGGIPQVGGTPPHVRIGRRWVNLLWILPVLAAVMVIAVAVAQGLRATKPVQNFIATNPGTVTTPEPPYTGFPWWLRWQHFFNLFFMIFIVRAGLQILADHPRLYWNRHSTPGTEWFRFQKPVPTDRIWTAKQDSVSLPRWFGIPGIRHSIGLARWWHFGVDLLWLVNGVILYVLLFATPQWERIVPTSLSVFPNALSALIQYLSLDFPTNEGWVAYNGLQLLAYFLTVFVAAPLALVTGLMQSPAIANRLRFAGRAMNRQLARSIHVGVLVWMVGFIIMHTVMVWTTGLLGNLNHITTGKDSNAWTGFWIYLVAMAVVVVAWALASPVTLRYPRIVQRVGRRLVGPLKGLLEHVDPKPGAYTEADISPHLWPNGTMPDSDEYAALAENAFRDFRLRVDGLVEEPCELSLDDLAAMERSEQITQHFCIQGWSGVAKWGGVPMSAICEAVRPLPEARYVAFYSFGGGPDGGVYYDVHSLEHMGHELTLLADEMNGEPLGLVHGAPLRLRNEVELGFKMVKWVRAIEFIDDYAHLGGGQGGYNEDHEFFGYRMPI